MRSYFYSKDLGLASNFMLDLEQMTSFDLNLDNFNQGYLVDEEWIGGVLPNPEFPTQHLAFIIS
ncbi:hypothetical protein KC976_04860, partial [Candidatus Saccharibacteria bacterium]|nr:hypothetical protein [Candidatus Saccharibacteria bacterium]